jgi:hypothetical protein
VYRINGSNDMLWWDLTFPWQSIFSFDGDHIRIISPSGQLVQETAGALINRWPYGSELLSIDAIGRRMGLANIMPTESATANHRIEESLLYPRVVLHLDFELNIPDRGGNNIQAMTECAFQKVSVSILGQDRPFRKKYNTRH